MDGREREVGVVSYNIEGAQNEGWEIQKILLGHRVEKRSYLMLLFGWEGMKIASKIE